MLTNSNNNIELTDQITEMKLLCRSLTYVDYNSISSVCVVALDIKIPLIKITIYYNN